MFYMPGRWWWWWWCLSEVVMVMVMLLMRSQDCFQSCRTLCEEGMIMLPARRCRTHTHIYMRIGHQNFNDLIIQRSSRAACRLPSQPRSWSASLPLRRSCFTTNVGLRLFYCSVRRREKKSTGAHSFGVGRQLSPRVLIDWWKILGRVVRIKTHTSLFQHTVKRSIFSFCRVFVVCATNNKLSYKNLTFSRAA